MPNDYKKSLEDEIDWKVIDQLHTATLNFSSTSLELKKILFIMVSIAVPTIIKLSNDRLDLSLFVTLYVLICTFWFLDSYTYFYQEKLREKMNLLFNSIRERNKERLIISESGKKEFTLEPTRTKESRLLRSAFNPSNRIYWILIMLNSIAFLLFILHVIR